MFRSTRLGRLAGVSVATLAVLTTGAVTTPAGAVPASPTGLAPADTTITTNPVLSWSSVPGAVKYDVQLSPDAGFSAVSYSTSTQLTTATPSSTAVGGADGSLYWRVRAVDASGTGGSWAVAHFVRTPFPGPALTSPAAGATLAFPANPPVFTWLPLMGAAKYVLQIDDASDFVSATSYSTANPSFVLTTPQPAQPYYWRVQGVTKDGVSTAFSEVRSYTIGAIGRPAPSYPPDTTDTPIDDVVLAWTAVAGAATYDLQVSPNVDFTNNTIDVQQLKATRWSPATTLLNGSYFWRVRARDAQGAYGDWSPIRSFRRAWPNKPVLEWPADFATATDQGPTFRWDPVPFADRYELDLGTDQNFSPGSYITCYTNHTDFTTQMTVDQIHQVLVSGYDPSCDDVSEPLPGGPYYWRVRGLDDPAGVLGVYSDVWSFTYEPGGDGTGGISQLTPADGASVTVPSLTWTAVPSASGYRVLVFDRNGTKVADTTTAALSWTSPVTLSPTSGPFTWAVSAVTRDGVSYASPRRSFSLTAPPGGGASPDPLTSSPGEGVRMPAMSWQPVSGATSYQVWFSTPGSSVFYQLVAPGTTGNYAYPAMTYPVTTSNGISVMTPGIYQWKVLANTSSGPVWSSVGQYVIDPIEQVTGEEVDSGWNRSTHLPQVRCTTGTSEQSACPESDTPTLRWSDVPDVGYYYVYVSTDAAHTNVVRTYSTIANSLTPRESLKDSQAGQTFYWFVRPCTADGACGPLGNPGSFEFNETFLKQSAAESGVATGVGTPPSTWPVPPCAPPVAAPTASPPTVADQVTFCWDDFLALTHRQGTLSDQDAKSYRLQVSTASDFSTLLDAPEVDQTTYTATTKTYPEGPIYWRVQAVDGSGNALTYSPTYQLLKSTPAPTVTAPSSGATLDQAPVLSWTPQPYAAQYEVEIYRNASASQSPDTNYSVANRVVDATTKEAAFSNISSLPRGTYAWRLRRLDADNRPGPWQQQVSGAPLVFSVTPAAPVLLSPASGSRPSGGSLHFTWSAAPAAAAYRFESSTNASFTAIRERVDTVSLAWAPTSLYASGTFYWRVSGLDASGNVLSTSDARWFTLDSTPPKVVAKSPILGPAVTSAFTATFSEPVAGVSAHSMQLWPAHASAPVAAAVGLSADALTATLRPAALLDPGNTYTVRLTPSITDLAGNPLAAYSWTVRATQTVDNTSPALRETWGRNAWRSAVGGEYLTTHTAAAAVTVRFTGTSAQLVARTATDGGYATVRLDGGPAVRVSFHSSVARARRVVWSRSGLRPAAHRLVVTATGTKPRGAKGCGVFVDALRVGSHVVNDTSSAWSMSLRRVHAAPAFDGSYDVEGVVGATSARRPSYTFGFTGIGVTLFMAKGPAAGKAAVYIDGRHTATVDLYAPRTLLRSSVYSGSTSNRHHTVLIVVTGAHAKASRGTNVGFDYAAIR